MGIQTTGKLPRLMHGHGILKMKNKGFTLIELIIVIIILGILAAIAIPNYTNSIERRRGEACINNIRVILSAEKIFYIKNQIYAPDTGGTINGINGINNQLNIDIQDNNFTYTIDNGVTQVANLVMRGTRVSGPYPGSTIEGWYHKGTKLFHFDGSWFSDIGADPPSFPIPTE